MTLTPCEQDLMTELEAMTIIDCHQHLGPESHRLATNVDVFTLFSHYTSGDLGAAGMRSEQYQRLFETSIPVARRWEIFEPFWQRIRHTSYARAALLTAAKFYGAEDITAQNCEAISEAIRKANTPGIYTRVLREACNIETSLANCATAAVKGVAADAMLTPVVRPEIDTTNWASLARPGFAPDATVRTLDDYLDALRQSLVRAKGEGAVGVKTIAQPFGAPDRAAAVRAFDSLRDGSAPNLPPVSPLGDYVVDRLVALATELDLVIAVHTGYWGDFRDLHPSHMIPLLQRHPRARFDIYHVGYPYVRDALMLGKGYSNVWLNFCWTHIISQKFACDAMDEAIDLLPTNKVLAFGGDYGWPVEKTYGHLVMAREDVARVLSARIARGAMTRDQALDLARQWFYDNAKALYRIGEATAR